MYTTRARWVSNMVYAPHLFGCMFGLYAVRRVAYIGVVNVCSDWLEYYHPSRLSTSHEANVVLRRNKLAGHFTFTYKFSQLLAYGLMVG